MASSNPASADKPLFYSNPVPLDRKAHRKLRTGAKKLNYGFARGTHVIPALIDEFAAACRELPIVFLPSAKAPMPVFMVGLEAGENRMIGKNGAWRANYVPAYLRRYPFIIGEAEGREPVICIDEGNTVLSEKEGDPLFDKQGEPTEALRTAITFSNEYMAAGKRTDAFVAILQEMDLFHPVTIQSRPEAGEAQTIYGLLAVNEPKLYELSDQDFLKLRKERLLAPVFAHLFSLAQMERLRETA